MTRLLLLCFLLASAARAAEEVRAYDVADLLTPATDFPPPALGVYVDRPTAPGAVTAPAPAPAPEFAGALARWFDDATAAALIERTARSPEPSSATWFVRASVPVHAAIARRLSEVRHERSLQIAVTASGYAMPLARRLSTYALPGCAWRAAGADQRSAVTRIPAEQATALRRALAGDAAVTPFSPPRLTTLSGQLAHAALVDEVPVREVVVDPSGRLAVAPRLLRVGETWTVRGRVLLDGATTALSFAYAACRIAGSEPAAGIDAEVPRLEHVGFAIDERLDAGDALVVAPSPSGGGDARLYLITVDVLDPDRATDR